jgi:uncharacterized membrane protein YfhO
MGQAPEWQRLILGRAFLKFSNYAHLIDMKNSLRQALVNSHIAAVTIAVLLLGSVEDIFSALWEPLLSAFKFLVTAVAIFDIPSYSRGLATADRFRLFTSGVYLYWAAINLFAAWLLSQWAYRTGPIRILTGYGERLIGRKDV